MSVEIDSSPDRSTCFSADPDGILAESNMDPESGEMVDSDSEAEGLSNLEEEDNDANEDADSQASADLEYNDEKEVVDKRRMNRFSINDQHHKFIARKRDLNSRL
jgi:hypothetical protein